MLINRDPEYEDPRDDFRANVRPRIGPYETVKPAIYDGKLHGWIIGQVEPPKISVLLVVNETLETEQRNKYIELLYAKFNQSVDIVEVVEQYASTVGPRASVDGAQFVFLPQPDSVADTEGLMRLFMDLAKRQVRLIYMAQDKLIEVTGLIPQTAVVE